MTVLTGFPMALMASTSTTCVCEPRNARLCCDKTCCSCDREVNGNRVVEISTSLHLPDALRKTEPCAPEGFPVSLSARISHIAGFPRAFCDNSINGVIFFLVCGTILSPLIMLLWTCCAIETTLELGHSRAGVGGVVARRSACCTWYTRVEGVTEVKLASSEGEGPDPVLLHHASGAARLEVSGGYVADLEAPVNAWIRSGGARPAGGGVGDSHAGARAEMPAKTLSDTAASGAAAP